MVQVGRAAGTMNTNNVQEKIALAVTTFMGIMGITALVGLIVRAGKVPDATTSALLGVVMATLAAMPTLLSKLSSAPAGDPTDPTSVTVENKTDDPIPVTTDKEKK